MNSAQTSPDPKDNATAADPTAVAHQIAELKRQLYLAREERDAMAKQARRIPDLEQEVTKLKRAEFIREPERVSVHIRNIDTENQRLRNLNEVANATIERQRQDIAKLETWIVKLERDIELQKASGGGAVPKVHGDDSLPPTPPPMSPPAAGSSKSPSPRGGPASSQGKQDASTRPQPKVITMPSPTVEMLQRSLGYSDPNLERSSVLCTECTIKIRALENSIQALKLEHERRQLILQNLVDSSRREVEALKVRLLSAEGGTKFAQMFGPSGYHPSTGSVEIPPYARSTTNYPTPSDGWTQHPGASHVSPGRVPFFFNNSSGTSQWASPYSPQRRSY